MEGISYESAQIAGHLKLDNLIVIYDANKVSLDGYLEESCSTDYVMLYQALGFDVFSIDGHDLEQIDAVLKPLRTEQKNRFLSLRIRKSVAAFWTNKGSFLLMGIICSKWI